jgi:hypothetical protein
MKFTVTAAVLGFATAISAMPINNAIIPDNISIYHGYGGKIEYNVRSGEVSRKQGGNDDISTLMTFYFGEATRGKKCEFMFELDGPDPYTVEGSPQKFIDVFFSSQYATESSPGWGAPSNYRDNQLGRLKPVKGSQATVEWGNFVFDCPQPGTYKGFEIAPTGDSTLVKWTEPNDGPWIRYY